MINHCTLFIIPRISLNFFCISLEFCQDKPFVFLNSQFWQLLTFLRVRLRDRKPLTLRVLEQGYQTRLYLLLRTFISYMDLYPNISSSFFLIFLSFILRMLFFRKNPLIYKSCSYISIFQLDYFYLFISFFFSQIYFMGFREWFLILNKKFCQRLCNDSIELSSLDKYQTQRGRKGTENFLFFNSPNYINIQKSNKFIYFFFSDFVTGAYFVKKSVHGQELLGFQEFFSKSQSPHQFFLGSLEPSANMENQSKVSGLFQSTLILILAVY